MHGIGTASRDVAAVRSRGRFGDTKLAHLSPAARGTLRRRGSSGARNPDTGLEEHWSFKDLLPILAPVALNFLAPGVGSGIGEALGMSGAAANVVGNALVGGGIGALTGGGRGALTGALSGGALAGFNEAGGLKGIGNALGVGGADASGAAAGASAAGGADSLGIEPTPEMAVGDVPVMQGVEMEPQGLAALAQDPVAALPAPPEMAPRGSAASTRGAGGVAGGTTLDKYKTPLLIGGGLLALNSLAGQKPQMGDDAGAVTVPADFGGPLPKYEMDRGEFNPLSDAELQMFGRAGRTQPAATGIFYETPNRVRRMAEGGKVAENSQPRNEKARAFEEYDKFRKPGMWRGDEVRPNSKPASGVRKAAERLSDLGRNGDTKLAHINPEEERILLAMGGSGTVNPHTGLREFFEGSDQADSHGDNSSGQAGGGSTGGPSGSNTDPDFDPQHENDRAPMSSADYSENALAAQHQGRSLPQKAVDYFSANVRDKARDIQNNPVRSAIDFALGFTPIGALNTLSGALGIGTLGGAMTSAARNATGYGEDTAAGQSVADATTPPDDQDSLASVGGDFYIPSPTTQLAGAPPPSVGLGASSSVTPTWQRNLTVPSDATLLNFGRGGQQQTPGGMFYDAPNFEDGGDVSDGRSDDVPAMLSKDEHVWDAETVALLGNGSNEAGHARLEKMKAEIRRRKGKALAKGKISPNAKMPKAA